MATIKALSASINSGTGSEAAQLAICMMLCVNSIVKRNNDDFANADTSLSCSMLQKIVGQFIYKGHNYSCRALASHEPCLYKYSC